MSALRLWHPTRATAADLAVGDVDGTSAGGAPLDVAVVAPPAQAGAAQLEAAIAEAARRLAPEGVAWIIVARRRRAHAERAAARAGLVVADRVLCVPPWPSTEHLVPLAPAALGDAGTRHLGLSPRVARILTGLCRVPALRLLASRAARGSAVVVARPGSERPWRWLRAIDGCEARAATVSIGVRADARVAVALRFRGGCAQPDLAVKVALDAAGGQRLRAERAALEHVARGADGAGAAVPVARACPGETLLVTGVLPGRPASALLARLPERLGAVTRAVAAWLLAWNRTTAAAPTATAAVLERRLLGPAERFAAAFPSMREYVGAMRGLAQRLEGEPLVTVAVHEDLTMANVLLSPGGIAVVDWESASTDGPALIDLWYALADAIACSRSVPHVRAVQMLVADLPRDAARLPGAHAAALGLSRDQALLGFHACWLGHADDELRRGAPGPFAAVVEAVAAQGLGPP